VGRTAVAHRGSQLSTDDRFVAEVTDNAPHLPASPAWLPTAIGAFFGLTALVRDAVLYGIFSFYVYPDSGTYLTWFWQRSRPYPVMGWITDAMDHPDFLVWLQILLGALATASLVWVIARRNPWLATTVGILFVLDLNWAITNRELLSEGALMSFSVLSLAVLGYQYEKRARLRPIALLLAGMLFAWTCTIRPSNLYLLVAIAGAYLLFTRSIPKTAWLSVGIVAVLLASSWLTLVQTGRFRVSGGTGYFVAFPLFSYHLFAASNGPASARIDSALRACDPNVDYSKVVILTSNQYLWGEYFPCLHSSGWTDDETDATFTSAYLEAIKAHPTTWLESWAGWFAIELGYPLSEPTETTSGACDPTVLRFCGQWQQDLASRPAAMEPTIHWETATERPTDPLRIIYAYPLVFLPNPFGDPFAAMDARSVSVFYVLLIFAIWLGVIALILWRTRGTIRVLALGSAVAIVYVCATVPAGHVFLPRYVAVLSPLQTVLSAVVIFAVARLAVDTVRRIGARRVAMVGASAAAIGLAIYLLVPPPVLYLIASRSSHSISLRALLPLYAAVAIVLAVAAVWLLPRLPMWSALTDWVVSWRRYPAEDVVEV